MLDTFVNKPNFVFILLFPFTRRIFIRVNPPLGNFTHVLFFFLRKFNFWILQHIHTLNTFACNNSNWTHSVFRCLFETNMLIPVPWNIYTFTCIKYTLTERWLFQCQRAEFRRKKTLYFWIKYKAVLDDLNCKIFFVSQPWWPTRFLGIYQLAARNLKWPPKSGIIWSRWPPGFKMLFPALQPGAEYNKKGL